MHDPDRGVVVLAVNNGEPAERVASVTAGRGYRFPVALDSDGSVHRAYGVTLRPTTVIVGPNARVLAVRVGAHSAAAMRSQLDRFGLPGNKS